MMLMHATGGDALCPFKRDWCRTECALCAPGTKRVGYSEYEFDGTYRCSLGAGPVLVPLREAEDAQG